MNIKRVREIFKESGWSTRKDEAGDWLFILAVSDRIIQVTPFLKRKMDTTAFVPMYSVSTEKFSQAEAFISASDYGYASIVTSVFDKNSIEVEKDQLIKEDIQATIHLLIEWACSVDIEAGLAKYRVLPTSAKGSYPLLHLAALACNGDVETLTRYQKSFELGDRLEFVPYITKEMIDRAVEFAKRS